MRVFAGALSLSIPLASFAAAEFGREPDAYLGLLALGLTMGQWLSLPMVAAGAALLWWSKDRPRHRVSAA
ncbi:MAG: hypothetical protein ACREQZ_07080 [Woeseiaceae bacterium]